MKYKHIEEWRLVPGFPDYEVSSLGIVRSNTSRGKGRVLKPALCGKGPAKYWFVGLYRENRRVTRVVHQLVLEAFVGPRPTGMVARHLDGNRLNCRSSNLAWGTPKDNMEDRRLHGRGNGGARNPRAKLTLTQVRVIRNSGLTKASVQQLASEFGVRPSTILNVFEGRRWRSIPW